MIPGVTDFANHVAVTPIETANDGIFTKSKFTKSYTDVGVRLDFPNADRAPKRCVSKRE